MRNLFSLYILTFQVFCVDGLFFDSLEKIFHYLIHCESLLFLNTFIC